VKILPLVGTLLGAASILGVRAEDDPRFNVLFLMADDLRPDLGCYGDTAIKSPNIDALARQGMLFRRAYCQVAVCNPSRASLLSGLRPDTTGIFDQSKFLRTEMPDVLTLPQLFKDHGYRSLSVGKVFHHSTSEPGNDPLSWSEPMFGFGMPYRHWFNQESDNPENRSKRGRGPAYEASDHPDDDYPDGKTAQKAIELLRENKDKPFFLAVGFIKPHLPFTCPQKYWDLYPAESIKLPENAYPPKDVPPMALQSGYELRGYGGMPPKGEIPETDALNLIRGYRACISFVDAQVGRVLEELERLGLREKTIVVLWGDHGYHLGENAQWTKMTNFEIATRVPLIISVPGQKTAGQASRALVESVDVYPTLAQLCRLPLPPALEGLSLVPLLDDSRRPWKTAAFSQYGRGPTSKFDPASHPMGRSIRTDRNRYTEWRDPQGVLVGTELYDQETDPQNTINIAARPESTALVHQLSTQLQKGWRAALPTTQP
jgi:iduronate 2-sulfatase